MPGVSREQIAKAKEIDLLSYLKAYEPYSIRKTSQNEYCLIEHDSLKISNGKWHWFSRGIGGKTALDFLIHVRGIDFVGAVQMLIGDYVSISHSQPVIPKQALNQDTKSIPKTKPFMLPQPNTDNSRVIAYLQSRGIDRKIIDRCIETGTLYESALTHNCVFVGMDNKNKARFACVRGTKGDFKQDIDGSDKSYGFTIPTQDSNNSLFVFESSIDALSQATMDLHSAVGDMWDKYNRISLSGISTLALMQYLKDNPHIDRICLCLDNDVTGQENSRKIKDMLKNTPHPISGYYKVHITPPPVGKDYNDSLLAIIQGQKIQRNKSKETIASL